MDVQLSLKEKVINIIISEVHVSGQTAEIMYNANPKLWDTWYNNGHERAKMPTAEDCKNNKYVSPDYKKGYEDAINIAKKYLYAEYNQMNNFIHCLAPDNDGDLIKVDNSIIAFEKYLKEKMYE